MSDWNSHDIALLFLSLGVLLASARLLGELAQRLGQPALIGELVAGVLLGPTVLGRIAPQLTSALFATTGVQGAVWESLTTLSIALFLLVAGMQVQLSAIRQRGTTALALASFVIPFVLGFSAAWLAPYVLGCELDANTRIFALFFAVAMSISAPSVIAQALMHLDLVRSDLGKTALTTAVFSNLIGWMIFAVVLGLLGSQSGGGWDVASSIALTLLFAALMLTAGRRLLHLALPWVQAHMSWPGGVMGLAISLALLAAALTEWIGIHAMFGAFLVGIAIGDSSHLRQQTRRTMLDFISCTFAPLFFASVGLRVDFAAKFDPIVIGSIVTIACLGKLLGCGLAARLTGLKWNTSWALGFALNARGTMEIILGLLALQNGLVRQRMFVALVILAVVTSAVSEPAIQRLLGRKRPIDLAGFISIRGFRRRMRAENRWEAMEELAGALPGSEDTDQQTDSLLWGGDVRIEWGGPDQEVAICLVTMDSLASPRVIVGISDTGIDFAPLAETPVHMVVFVATPADQVEMELAIEDDIVRKLASERAVREALASLTLTEFLAALRTSEKESAQTEAPVA